MPSELSVPQFSQSSSLASHLQLDSPKHSARADYNKNSAKMGMEAVEIALSQMALFCFIVAAVFGSVAMKRIMVPGGGR